MKITHLSNKRVWRKSIALIPVFIAAICVFSTKAIAQNTVMKSWGGIVDANTIAGWGNSVVTATKQGDGAAQLKVANGQSWGFVESEFYTVNFDRDPEMVIWLTGASSTTESNAGNYYIKMTTGKNPAGDYLVGDSWIGSMLGSIQTGSRGQKLVIPLKPLRASKLTGTDIVKMQVGLSGNVSGASTYMNIKNIEMRYASNTVLDWDANYLAKDIVDMSQSSMTPYVQMVGGTAGFVVDGTRVGEAILTYGDYLVDFDYDPVVKLDIDTDNTTGLVIKVNVDGTLYEMTGKMPVNKLQSQMTFNIKNLRTHTVLTGIHPVKIGIGTFKDTPGDTGRLSLRSMDFAYASTVKATATYIAPQLSGTRAFVTVHVQSFKEDPIPVTVIAELYDGVYESKGIRLVSSVTENISVSKDNPEAITVKLPVPKGTDITNTTIKTFVLNGGNPITATATQISGYTDKIRAVIDIDAKNKEKEINKELFGIFLEDLSRALDGGLNAQLVQNMSFEYSADDTYSRNSVQKLKNTPLFAWRPIGNVTLNVNNATPMNSNNTHYLEFTNNSGGLAGVLNTGYTNNITDDSQITQAIIIKNGEMYEFSFFINTTTVKPFTIRIVDAGNTKVYAEAKITPNGAAGWQKYSTSLASNASDNNARLVILTLESSMIKMDMISLMPAVTFMGHGMRKDLAQVIADMNPAIMRFPGGGLVTGDYNLGSGYHLYHWKETVGPLEQRVSRPNLWGYNQSYQIGFYEFFQFCEDIGAEPLPCIPMGQGIFNAVPMSEMQKYVDDALDLVEFANGDPNTNHWAKLRADMGHPQPFGLKYIQLGNEQESNAAFKERHTLIADALREKYPELIIVGNSGNGPDGRNFEISWAFAIEGAMDIVDEHAYRPASWFVDGYHRFDTYDPNGPKVFFGEYAAAYEDYYSALAEAVFMMGMEKNADVVHLAAYAPLLVKQGYDNWGAAIRFDNNAIVLSPSYYVQKMFCSNNGTQTLANSVKYSLTSTSMDKKPYVTTVYDEVTKDIIVKIVNLNSKAIESTVNMSNAKINDGTASCEVLQTDNLGNRNTFAAPNRITPYTDQVDVSSNQLTYTAKPYSLNIIRIKTN